MSANMGRGGASGGASFEPPDMRGGDVLSSLTSVQGATPLTTPEYVNATRHSFDSRIATRLGFGATAGSTNPASPSAPLSAVFGSQWLTAILSADVFISALPFINPSPTATGIVVLSVGSPQFIYSNRAFGSATATFINEVVFPPSTAEGDPINLILPGRKDYRLRPGETVFFHLLGGANYLAVADVRDLDDDSNQTIALTGGGGSGSSGEFLASDFDGVVADPISPFSKAIFVNTTGAVVIAGADPILGRRQLWGLSDASTGTLSFADVSTEEPTATNRFKHTKTVTNAGTLTEYVYMSGLWRAVV